MLHAQETPRLEWMDERAMQLDRLLHAATSRLTFGLAPAALSLAWADWAIHLAASPGKWQFLQQKALRKAARLGSYALRAALDPSCPDCIDPLPRDHRFADPAWRRWPFNLWQQSFLLCQQWWHNTTTDVRGVAAHHEQMVEFAARQWLDAFSPTNFLATNPVALGHTLRQGGANLLRGAMNWARDWERAAAGKPPAGAEKYRPGREVAATPGQVVYRNRLIELIQYTPVAREVHAEPVLIVPAWIMKYYILDLSPQNSLVRYLLGQGHSVFMISWHNPDARDRDLGLDDYLKLGVLEALRVVRQICGQRPVDALGYCLGGTLLSIAAAYLAREGRAELNSVTLLATQTDFTEPGELSLFIDDSQLDYLDDIMWTQGFLDPRLMSGAFQLLRSNDLLWSRLVHEYLMGEAPAMSDLMAWNADSTRLPYRMHSEYLHRLFLNNELFEGKFTVDGRPVALSDIRVPLFVVATELDHIAPWRSVYKLNLVLDTEVTFVLGNGGHNAGIVSEPGHAGRHYRIALRALADRYVDPDSWLATTSTVAGSWWPAWAQWLAQHSTGLVAPPINSAPEPELVALGPAPGRYVFES